MEVSIEGRVIEGRQLEGLRFVSVSWEQIDD